MWTMFLDDERTPEQVTWATPVAFVAYFSQPCLVVRSVQQAKDYILALGSMPSFVSFDHDLGPSDETGYTFAKWLVDQDLSSDMKFAKHFAFFVHSKNPIGAANIKAYLENYFKQRQS